jgi:type VII secretion integral membrane protein EccD
VTFAGLCRLTIVAPTVRVDLAVPANVPIAVLLPDLVGATGHGTPDGGASHGGWCLSRPGAAELDPAATLDAAGAVDGDVLLLRPRSLQAPPPIFDDVVDAIAETSRRAIVRWSPAHMRWFAAVAAALSVPIGAVTLLRSGWDGPAAPVAGGCCAALLAVAAVASRRYDETVVAAGLGIGALSLAFAAALLVEPTATDRVRFGLGCAGWVAGAVTAAVALGTGTVAFTAAATGGSLTGGAALVAVLVAQPVPGMAAGTLCTCLGAATVVPRAAARLARIPVPTVVLGPGVDDATLDAEPDLARLEAHTRRARAYLRGGLVGCLATAGGCCVVLAISATPAALTTAGLGLLAVIIPGRRAADAAERATRLVIGIAGAGTASMWLAVTHPAVGPVWRYTAALVLAVAVVICAVSAPRLRFSPTSRRLLDAAEAMVVAAVLPVAAQVMQLYAAVRHR